MLKKKLATALMITLSVLCLLGKAEATSLNLNVSMCSFGVNQLFTNGLNIGNFFAGGGGTGISGIVSVAGPSAPNPNVSDTWTVTVTNCTVNPWHDFHLTFVRDLFRTVVVLDPLGGPPEVVVPDLVIGRTIRGIVFEDTKIIQGFGGPRDFTTNAEQTQADLVDALAAQSPVGVGGSFTFTTTVEYLGGGAFRQPFVTYILGLQPTTNVPEPNTLLLLGSGIIMLAYRYVSGRQILRRKRKL